MLCKLRMVKDDRQGSFKDNSRMLQGSLKYVKAWFNDNLNVMDDWRMKHELFKGVSSFEGVLFNNALRIVQQYFKDIA